MNEELDMTLDQVEALDMAALRRATKMLGIKAETKWTKLDFIKAIKDKDAGTPVSAAEALLNAGPKPGFARILIHRDPTPGHKNTPIHIGVNGMLLQAPRGIELDVPIPFVEVLKNSVSAAPQLVEQGDAKNPSGTYKDVEHMSYPFQVLAITPGKDFRNPQDNRSAQYARREAFEKKFGRWPTAGELSKWLDKEIDGR